jgi:hypothetical protein
MEQLAVSLTTDPDEEGTPTATAVDNSWFGRLLADNFQYEYQGNASPERYDKKQMVTNYFTKSIEFSAYDWECSFWELTKQADGTETGVVEGAVDVKVRHCDACAGSNAHNGEFHFRYEISRPDATSSWKINKWIMTKKADGASSPKISFI